jgi:hypothetical protein
MLHRGNSVLRLVLSVSSYHCWKRFWMMTVSYWNKTDRNKRQALHKTTTTTTASATLMAALFHVAGEKCRVSLSLCFFSAGDDCREKYIRAAVAAPKQLNDAASTLKTSRLKVQRMRDESSKEQCRYDMSFCHHCLYGQSMVQFWLFWFMVWVV